MKNNPSLIGGSCIIASICVGAGMLGLPVAGAGAWVSWSLIVMAITMIIMTISGWMLLEAFKHYDLKASFNTVTKDMLGDKVNFINNIAVYFVGGILLYAYITSSGLILEGIFNIDIPVIIEDACIFVKSGSCYPHENYTDASPEAATRTDARFHS